MQKIKRLNTITRVMAPMLKPKFAYQRLDYPQLAWIVVYDQQIEYLTHNPLSPLCRDCGLLHDNTFYGWWFYENLLGLSPMK